MTTDPDEYAPGIPSKSKSHELRTVKEPEVWEHVVHEHHARRRGRHFDLRLGDPKTGHGHSWAMDPKWPKPGEVAWAIQQPTHTIPYFDFEGQIPEGYGAGVVDIKNRDKVEVQNASPGHVTFAIYRGSGPEEYTLHRIGDKNWKLYNRTLHRQKHPNLPSDKPAYREKEPTAVDFTKDEEIWGAKIDGAHNLLMFPETGARPRLLSYKPSERETGVIEHTHKVEALKGLRTPASLAGTMLRVEAFAIDPRTKKALASKDLGGLLNSNVWKSREKQTQLGKLRLALIDAVFHKRKPVDSLGYDAKLEIMKHVLAELPGRFVLPRLARTEKQKRALFEDVRTGQEPTSEEGVVIWNRHEGKPPTKVKFRTEHDVYIRGFYPAEKGTKYTGVGVGGFTYSHEPKGAIAGRVGTGLTDKQRIDMFLRPGKYVGAVAKVRALDVYPLAGDESKKGALRAPAFVEWHLDKTPQHQLDRLA